MSNNILSSLGNMASLIKENLSGKLLGNSDAKNILIHQKAIEIGLKNYLSEDRIVLKKLTCASDRMILELEAEKYFARIQEDFELTVDKLILSPQEHHAIFRILNEKLYGKNFLGYIFSSLLKILLEDIIAGSISRSKVKDYIEYDKKNRIATVDLIEIDKIRELYEKRGVLGGKMFIDFIEIKNITHEIGGLRVYFEAGHFSDLMKTGATNILNSLASN